jgi:hypothetical protein
MYKWTGNFLEDQLIIPHSLNQTASSQPISILSRTAKNVASAYFALFVATNEKNNSNIHVIFVFEGNSMVNTKLR